MIDIVKGLQDDITNQMLKPTFDLTKDYAEIGLDQILDSELAKSIPVLKQASSVLSIVNLVRERHFAQKLFTFLQSFHNGKETSASMKKFQQKINSDSAYRKKVIDQIVIYIDRYVNISKPKILAKLLKAHIENKFDWEQFLEMAAILDRLPPSGYKILHKMSQYNFTLAGEENKFRDKNEEIILQAAGIGLDMNYFESYFEVTHLGKKLYNFGIKDLVENNAEEN